MLEKPIHMCASAIFLCVLHPLDERAIVTIKATHLQDAVKHRNNEGMSKWEESSAADSKHMAI